MTAPDDEAALVRRAQARDIPAFESLYRIHLGRVHAICRRMLGDAGRAEELTQQAFLSAWEKLPRFRGDAALGSWLHRIAVNAVLAHLRSDRRLAERVVFTDDPASLETARPAPAPGSRIDLEAAIAELPPQARIVFVLHDVEGWKHHEISGQLGVTTGTTKAQLHRARKLLQEALQ